MLLFLFISLLLFFGLLLSFLHQLHTHKLKHRQNKSPKKKKKKKETTKTSNKDTKKHTKKKTKKEEKKNQRMKNGEVPKKRRKEIMCENYNAFSTSKQLSAKQLFYLKKFYFHSKSDINL